MSFYLDTANRDSFMAIKQDLLLAFIDCVQRNGAALATPRTTVGGTEIWQAGWLGCNIRY
jgi:hypothetical protein